MLFAIPGLISQGLNRALTIFSSLPNGYYGLQHIILLMCFMALCRIKSPEELKKSPPGEWGKLLGLDRIPEVGYLRKKIGQVIQQSKADELQRGLFEDWTAKLPDLFFYIDGHVRVYHGSKANLPKRFVSREKLCLNGTTEFWVNSQDGMPLMVITGELNEKLKVAIIKAIQAIKQDLRTTPQSKDEPVFTLIFDRESYEPSWFKSLIEDHQVAVITYRKNVTDKWNENLFETTEYTIMNNKVTDQLCEMGVQLNGLWFREVRKLSDNGHQTSILTTHPSLKMELIAEKIFSRWTQENFFKYMSENFNFDRVLEYGFEEVSDQTIVSNPQYNQVNYQLKKAREKQARLKARMYNKIEDNEEMTIDQVKKKIAKHSDVLLKIDNYEQEINHLLEKRKSIPAKIKIKDMPEEKRYNKLKTESKKLKNILLMIAYRAETALYNLMNEFYKNNSKDGRMLLKEVFTTDADFIPDYQNRKLNIVLHCLSTNRYNQAIQKLCDELNQTETTYPGTDLVLYYKSGAF